MLKYPPVAAPVAAFVVTLAVSLATVLVLMWPRHQVSPTRASAEAAQVGHPGMVHLQQARQYVRMDKTGFAALELSLAKKCGPWRDLNPDEVLAVEYGAQGAKYLEAKDYIAAWWFFGKGAELDPSDKYRFRAMVELANELGEQQYRKQNASKLGGPLTDSDLDKLLSPLSKETLEKYTELGENVDRMRELRREGGVRMADATYRVMQAKYASDRATGEREVVEEALRMAR